MENNESDKVVINDTPVVNDSSLQSIFKTLSTAPPATASSAVKVSTPFVHFPFCPVRVGRVYDSDPNNPKVEAVVTCGYEKTTIEQCINCDYQRSLKENQRGNDMKVFRNSKDIERLKVELGEMQDTVLCLMFIVGVFLQERMEEGGE